MTAEHIFGLSDTQYGLMIAGCTVLVMFGSLFVIALLFQLRDLALSVITSKKAFWPIRVLAIPVWFVLFLICLVIAIISIMITLGAIADIRDWWNKG